jgi:SAM-dependent methyltransferase
MRPTLWTVVRRAPPSLPLTGERTVPGRPEERYWFRRHVAAYRLANRLACGIVVDAGSGEGYGTAMLAGRGQAVGIELDPSAAAHAAARYRAARFMRADLCRLPLGDRSVDAVVALQVIEHLRCVEAFVEGCRRSLRRGGLLIVSTPNRSTFPAGQNPSHVHEFEAAELREVLAPRFDEVRLVGVRHRLRLAALDRALGEPVPHLLVRTPYQELPLWVRLLLRTVTSRDFAITEQVKGCLDLVAVCRVR